MSSGFWDRYAFSIGGVDFSWMGIIVAAMVRGDWSAFERRLAEGLACAARASAEDAPLPPEAIDEAATAFRYDRDLISAADITEWLDRIGISADEWTDYLSRDLLRRRWDDELDDTLDRFAPSSRELLAAAPVDGRCSGAFDAFEEALAGRAAVVFEADAAEFHRAGEDAGDATVGALVSRLAQTHAHWLAARPAAGVCAKLATVARLDAAFVRLADGIASNGRLGDIVNTHRLGWTRMELDIVSFATEAAAREAILCVREDRLSLYDVASLARRTVSRERVMLDDVDADRRDTLLAAEPGHLPGPLCVDGRFDVAALVARTAPSLDDPAVAARARAMAIDAAQQAAARDHVTRRATRSVSE